MHSGQRRQADIAVQRYQLGSLGRAQQAGMKAENAGRQTVKSSALR
jgi:hypothetical protein